MLSHRAEPSPVEDLAIALKTIIDVEREKIKNIKSSAKSQLSLSIFRNYSFLSLSPATACEIKLILRWFPIMQLDDWVLCRIYNKKGTIEKFQPSSDVVVSRKMESSEIEDRKPEILKSGGGCLLPPVPPPQAKAAVKKDYMYFDPSDSIPKLHTDSSCSEQVVSPEFASEVQSEPKWNEWEKSLEFPFNYVDATLNNSFMAQFQGNNQMLSPLQDMFMYWPNKSF